MNAARNFIRLFLLVATGGISVGEPANLYGPFKSLGYYPDYNSAVLPVPDIRPDRFTHVIFFSIYPDAEGTVQLNEVNLSRLVSLVTIAHAQGVKVLVCVGGWGLSDGFSPMAANAAARTAFIENIRDFCVTYDLDGVDLDWEPVRSLEERRNYTALITELKPVLAQKGLSLSIAVFAGGQEFLPSAIGSIDWVGVMAYDLGYPHSSFEEAVTALNHWETFGFERSRIVLGIPFYGRDAGGTHFSYRSIVDTYSPEPHEDLASGISYNGVVTVQRKTAHALSNGYGGVMFWEITQDTADATSLLTASAQTVHLGRPPDLDGNDLIDAADFQYFASEWLRKDCTEQNTWCGRADLDASGAVSLSDLALLAAFWTSG